MVFAPKRTVTTLPAASSVPASALWEMAVTLPVLPPVLVAPAVSYTHLTLPTTERV